jgi:hypothetical protein
MQIHEQRALPALSIMDYGESRRRKREKFNRLSKGKRSIARALAQSRQRQQECIINNAQSMALQY